MNLWLRDKPWHCALAPIQWMVLVGFLVAMAGFRVPAQGAVDYTPFYKALEAGDDAGAIAIGRNLYMRLAVQADGQEPFYSCGVVLVTAQQATDYIKGLQANPDRPNPWNPLESLWRILPAPLKGQDGPAGQEEPGRFLRAYLRLCVISHMQQMLAAGPASASMPAGTAEATADHLVLLMGMLNIEAVASDAGPPRAIAWIVAAGQGERATGQALGHGRPAVACAVGKAALAAKPADSEVRRQLVELVAALCKAQYVAEALSLCAAAKDITQDASYSSILILQQALIASRDQKNHALAVRLCDEVAAAADDANTILVAKYLAGTFLLEQQEYPQVVTRMASLAKDPATPLPYRLKASTLGATAWIRQDKPQEAARALAEVLAGLAEPEPAEAADSRQVLCQAMLAMQRYDEAARECRVLIARHPGHAGAGVAAQLLEQMGRKPDELPAESRK